MKKLAIITARGGSKRIPQKNIKEFYGKPIIQYSIESAIESGLFDKVMVSTDDAEIAALSGKFGAEVPFMRSEKTSDDYATTYDVLSEVIANYENMNQYFDIICCIYPTAPFVTSSKLVKAMNQLIQSDADSLMPVVKFSYPPQRALLCENNSLRFQYNDYINSRSQDLEPIYHDCGQFYMFKVNKFKEANSLIIGKCVPFFVSEEECQDIDNISDWKIAEMKYKMMVEKEDSKK